MKIGPPITRAHAENAIDTAKRNYEQKIVNMQNPEEVNKLLSQGYIFLSTVNTTDATFALLEKRN